MKVLANKVAVVTGAGGALGRALALACARRGMRLVLADVDSGSLAQTGDLIRDEVPGAEWVSLRVNVSKYEEVESLATLACERFGGAHLLFNNAGVGMAAPIWENTADDWQWVTSVNLFGVAWGVRAFAPIMLRQSEGHIVNIASAAGWFSPPGSGIYNTTKAAVVALSETLANDLVETGKHIGVSVVSPAYFQSGITNSERNRPGELSETAKLSEIRRAHEEQVKKAVEAGQISATQIAEVTLEAVEQGRFYVFPHTWVPDGIAAKSKAARLGRTAFNPQA